MQKTRSNKKIKSIDIKQKGIVLPLYFGWQIRIVLERIKNLKKHIWGPFKKYWQYITAVMFLILCTSIYIYFYGINPIKAATYNFIQTSWTGGATTTAAVHANNQTGWTYYESKDENLVLAESGTELQLSTIASSTAQSDSGTTNTGFNLDGGSLFQTEVVGTDNAASVKLTGDVTAINDWSRASGNLAQVPGASSYGMMTRNGSDDEIYVLQGNSTGFSRYSISANTFTPLAPLPLAAGQGAFMIRNGAEDSIYVLRGGVYAQFYKYSILNNSWTTLTAVPANVAFGSFMLRNGDANEIYVMAGNGATGFYRYSISGNSWETLTAVPGAVSMGGYMQRNGADNNIYVLRGNGTANFYRYSISGNSWETLTAVPAITGHGSSIIRNGSDNEIYVLAGNQTTAFYRYSISGNSWETLTAVPGRVYYGGSMLRNGSDNEIYVLAGNQTTSFYRYSISGNSWETLTPLLSQIGNGGYMLRNGSDNEIYVLGGNLTTAFYRYSISGNSWESSCKSKLIPVPDTVGAGSAMLRNGLDNDIYVLIGNNKTGFYKYSISDNSWTTLTPVPVTVKTGGYMIRNGAEDEIYVLPANGTAFYKYSIQNDSWTTLAQAPSFGTFMIRNGSDDEIYAVLPGNPGSLSKYSIANDSWEVLQSVVLTNTSRMVRNGSDIFITQGGANFSNVFKYSILDNSITTIAAAPGGTLSDSFMLHNGSEDFIYFFRGGSINKFFRYSISGNSWTTLTPVPNGVAAGSFMIRNGSDDEIYVTPGYTKDVFYKYSIAGDSWTTLNNVTGTVDAGSFMLRSDSDNDIYLLHGGNMANFSKFTINSVSYDSSGTFTSGVIDTGKQISSWGNLSWTQSGGQTITVKARSCATNDCAGATEWASCDNINSGSPLSSGNCINVGDRYFQYLASLSTTDSLVTPSLDDITFAYNFYPASQSLISSKYDSSSDNNLIGYIAWEEDESSPLGTTIQFSLRTASTSADLDSASWNDYLVTTANCSKTGVKVTCSRDAIPASMKDGVDDRWFQYKVALGSDGAYTPKFTQGEISYAVNMPPEFNPDYPSTGNGGVSASQNPDGTVSINYSVRDVDTLCEGVTPCQNVTPGYVTPSFQYSLDGGASWHSITSEYLASGDLENKEVAEDNYTAYSATWNPKAQISGNYSAQTKIRVTVNDNESAQNTATSDSSVFTLDVKNPTQGEIPMSVIATTSPAGLLFNITDDSSIQMQISLNADFSGASWENYAATSSISLQTNPDTVYARFKDEFNNITSVSAITPESSSYMVIRDITNIDAADYQLFIAWKAVAEPSPGFKNYEVWYSTTGSDYALLETITERTRNYYMHTGLDSSLTYYYKVVTQDNNGNTSYFSTAVNDSPDGQGGTDTTPPTISNVQSTAITTQSATITWDTDELSDSTVGYSAEGSPLFGAEIGSPQMADTEAGVGQHSVTLTGLTPGTTYYFQVQAKDIDANETTDNKGGEGYQFSTNPGPLISNVTQPSITNTGAVINWTTDVPANSTVVYSINSNLSEPTEVHGSTNLVTNHEIEITGLSQGTKYYYYVESTFGADVASDNNGGEFYNFVTTNDTTAPNISSLEASVITDTKAVITWTTDERADSKVNYGTVSGNLISSSTDDNLNTGHSITLAGLSPKTRYYYQVDSVDASGNSTSSPESSFITLEELSEEAEVEEREATARQEGISSVSMNGGGGIVYVTLPAATDKIAPLISEVKVSDITSDSATINWETDESSDTFVEYGLTDAYGNIYGSSRDNSNLHTVKLKWLTPETTYHYRTTSADSSGNIAHSEGAAFTTLSIAEEIENQTNSQNEGEENNQDPEGLMQIASQAVMKAMSIIKETVSKVSIGSLESTLVFQQTSLDDLARAIPAPLMSGEPQVLTTAKTAAISWKTDKESNSLIAIAAEPDYKASSKDPYAQVVGNPTDKTLEHMVIAHDLEPDTVYHYQLRSKGYVGQEARSNDFTFKTKKEILEIGNYNIQNVSNSEAIFKWATNIESDSTIRYTPYRNDVLSLDEMKTKNEKAVTTIHEINIDDFESGVIYKVELVSRDMSDNTANKILDSFSTSEDDLPPVIYQVQTTSAISPGKEAKIQSIISWMTSEPSTSKVYYQTGVASSEKVLSESTKLDSNYTKKHVMVITKFDPGRVYSFRVESTDSGGNIAQSKVYTVLTPQQSDSVFQVIMKNMGDVFGWMTKIKQ